MAGVVKSNGKYILEPNLSFEASLVSADDRAKLKKEMTLAELRDLLIRVLMRLDALEKK